MLYEGRYHFSKLKKYINCGAMNIWVVHDKIKQPELLIKDIKRRKLGTPIIPLPNYSYC